MECEFIFTWQGQNKNIPLNIYTEEILANTMHDMSKSSPYAPSLAQLQAVLTKSLREQNENCFLATVFCCLDKKIVGFLTLSFVFTDADIHFICIDFKYRRKYLAEKLLTFFEDKFKQQQKNTNIFLEVGVDNKSAIAFYEKMGFQKISVRKKYYKNKEDAFVMKKG